MEDKIYNGYERASNLESDIKNLNDSIDNIGDDNIINHSRVADIENDIKRIENNIKITNRKNIGKTCIRNIKIFGRALQGIFPYVVAAGLVFTGQTLLGDVPFYPQDQFKVAQHEQTFDNNGIISDKVTYINASNDIKNSAYYSTKWEKKADGKYYREIKEYDISNLTIEQLHDYILNPGDDIDENVFGKSEKVRYEVKEEKDITKEDLSEKTGIKIVYRYTDDEDVILAAQDVGPNILLSLLYLFLSFVACLPVMLWRDEDSDFDFKEYVYDYCKEYRKVDITELEKLFKEKKIKFDIVRHQDVNLVDPITEEKMLVKTKRTI